MQGGGRSRGEEPVCAGRRPAARRPCTCRGGRRGGHGVVAADGGVRVRTHGDRPCAWEREAGEESGRGRPAASQRRGGGGAALLGRSMVGQPGGVCSAFILAHNGEGERGAARLYNLGIFGPDSWHEQGLKGL